MNSILGHLNKTLRFSTVDGPGNRFVLFLQGCNFNCINCHNPYTITECNSCGLCVGSCPENALTALRGPTVNVDRAACTDCDLCIAACPYDSTPLASFVTVEEVVAQIRETARFVSGVTVSGGEATLQPEFVTALFTAIKDDPALRHLTTLVDSNGSAAEDVWNRMLPVMDGAMIDLKALDRDTHVRLTARDNDAVLHSIRHLAANRKLYEVRLLVVPGYNDAPEAMQETVEWLRAIDEEMRIKVIGYRAHGVRPEFDYLPSADPAAVASLGDLVREAGMERVLVV